MQAAYTTRLWFPDKCPPDSNYHPRTETPELELGLQLGLWLGSVVVRSAVLERFSSLFVYFRFLLRFQTKAISCSHVIYNVRNVIENYTSHGSTVNVGSIDLFKAFDRMISLCSIYLHLHLFRSRNNNNTIKWQKNRTTRHIACSNSWWNEGFLWHFLYYWINGLKCQLLVYGGIDMILIF